MLDLYLDDLLTGHKLCSMFENSKWITLQTDLQMFVINNVFWTKRKNATAKQKLHHKSMPEPGTEPGTSLTAVWSLTSWTLRQLNVSIVIKLFNCFNVNGRNINKHFLFVCNILACIDNYVWQFLKKKYWDLPLKCDLKYYVNNSGQKILAYNV